MLWLVPEQTPKLIWPRLCRDSVWKQRFGCDGSPSWFGPQPSVLPSPSPPEPPALTHLHLQGPKSVGGLGGLGQGLVAEAGAVVVAGAVVGAGAGGVPGAGEAS